MSRGSSDKPNKGDAYEKALAFLVRREHSGRELKSKLVQRGFDPDQTAAAIESLKQKDFQNDARFGEMLVRSRLEGGYGARWIVAELRTHGIAEEAARELIAAAEPDWLELARRQLRRRYGHKPAADYAERTKRGGFLLRRGFDASTVKLATHDARTGASSSEPD